jgi:hypothetical protein
VNGPPVRVVECSGAPRDLGRDLGTALCAEVRAAVAEQGTLRGALTSLRETAATTRLHRDLRRYFPHQAEWLEGLALGTGVTVRVLVRALAQSCAPGAPQGVVVGAVSGTAVAIAGAVPRAAVWRRVAPEGRFRSLEVSLPAASAPVIGVNEAGLAVAVAEQRALPGRFAPPLALFARDCLERFERVEPALEWCLARPAAPGGSLVLADANGELAGVYAGGSERRALRPPSWLVLGDAGLELAKAEPLSVGQLEPALANALASLPGAGPAVLADPIGCRLRAGDGEWIWAAE